MQKINALFNTDKKNLSCYFYDLKQKLLHYFFNRMSMQDFLI